MVAYFHENQVSYPTRQFQERDNHFAITQWLSALSVERCIFNSRYNLKSFIDGTRRLLKKMPEKNARNSLSEIENKSCVIAPGIDAEFFFQPLKERTPSTIPVIGWCGRWEHDKNPQNFFQTLARLDDEGFEFSLIFLGQSFREVPEEIEKGLKRHRSRTMHAGFAESRENYRSLLMQMDYCISTALHEFFGLALLEAAAAGAQPIAPARLVYPELYPDEFLFADEDSGLYEYLKARLPRQQQPALRLPDHSKSQSIAMSYDFSLICRELDQELERACLS